MRRSWGVATLATVAIGTLGVAGGGGAAGAAEGAAETSFTVTDVVTDPGGATHVRVDRTYDGLRVLGGDRVVHRGPDDSLQGVSQTLDSALRLATDPLVPADRAETRALAPARATAAIDGLRAEGAPELVVDALGDAPRLAWEVTTHGTQDDGTPSRLATYVDARTGAVLRRVEGIHTAEGSGQSLYSGTVPLSITQSGSSYTLTDPARGNARTTDMRNREDSILCQLLRVGCSAGTAYSSTDTSFGSGTNANRESAAVDAHYGGATTFDYFKLVHGRNGIFGDGRGVPSRVHYGNGYVNAFWDGSQMTYGDGDGTEFGPLVSLDVAGHEMTHGVTENTANLTYSGESGGLNEATSDIFGTMVEFHAANSADPGDYLIGEEFDLGDHRGFRRMDDPDSDGASQNCWTSGTQDLDVHYSSGVGNHFFYLLAEGSGARTIGGVAHSSSTCDGSTVAGIGRDAAARIWFRALSVYMTSGTDYAGARTATLDAASDLYGAASAQRAAVAAAWSAVNVS
ncbi:MAG TPA: M4 family metallopeptidase [Nocardioides sp.]|uniref:M4 family metallopeptidase n=1 Tax=Nocardioides sp. TaxID=35761 RepID=UPI002CC67CD4|nr:M4 family metallopeptidase [Nocardioides sp.]HTW13561.1 M4 family metallopeptidase [Nocardioides sp.]